MSRNVYSSVEQICFSNCMQVTPHDIYAKCRVCGNFNQEKTSPADEEREKELKKNKNNPDNWDYGM